MLRNKYTTDMLRNDTNLFSGILRNIQREITTISEVLRDRKVKYYV